MPTVIIRPYVPIRPAVRPAAPARPALAPPRKVDPVDAPSPGLYPLPAQLATHYAAHPAHASSAPAGSPSMLGGFDGGSFLALALLYAGLWPLATLAYRPLGWVLAALSLLSLAACFWVAS